MIKTERMNKMIKTRSLLKRACATEAQTGISKRENGSSRLSPPRQNDQAFHLSLPPISSVHADGPKKAVTSEEEAAATEVTCEGVAPGRHPATHTRQQQWLQVKQCME